MEEKFKDEIVQIAEAINAVLPHDDYNEDVTAEIILKATIESGTPAIALLKAMTNIDFKKRRKPR